MVDLDLSGLTDDQLVELVRACCRDAVRRNPAIAEAARDVMLDEAEKARIAAAASEAERAAMRARERERIAREAADRARAEEEARQAPARAEAARRKAQALADQAEAIRARDMAWLRAAAELVGRHPSKIALLKAHTRHGLRVFINPNGYRYTREHLFDFNVGTGAIQSVAALVKNKPDAVQLLARLATELPLDAFIAGNEYPWPPQETT